MSLNSAVKQYFDESEYRKLSEKLAVIRNDGISIYSNMKSEAEVSSIGALIGGLWQAAEALGNLTSGSKEFFDYRLSFDTSADGIYILPFNVGGEKYFIGVLYQDKDNPGKVKRYFRMLKDNLELYLSDFKEEKVEEKRDGFLFNDISDDEMDNLFSFGGV